jgi:hypothetical protein
MALRGASKPLKASFFRNPQALDFLKPRLVQSGTSVVIPLDHRVFFIRPLHRAQFPRRLSEIAQTLDSISGTYFRLLWRRLDEGGLSCTV